MEQVNRNSYVSLNWIIAITLIIDWSLAEEFDYKNVDSWTQIAPQCGGQRQSPVSVDYADLDDGDYDVVFSKINYDNKPLSAKLSNDGHTIIVQFEWDENKQPHIAGGVLGEDVYVQHLLSFHWSRSNNEGSEHILFRYSFSLEMHSVHYNRKYGSFANASNYDDGLAIIGSLFELLEERQRRDSVDDYDDFMSESLQESPGLNQILNNLGSVRTPGSSVDIEPFALSEFRPVQQNQTLYISYLGSLTTPPCTENVLWLLSTYPYHISTDQLEYLQSTVELDHGDDHNNRPVQTINGRKFTILPGNIETIV